MTKTTFADILELSVEERILLVEDIWESIAAVPDAFVLTKEQREELALRMDEYHRNPASGLPWDEVKARLK